MLIVSEYIFTLYLRKILSTPAYWGIMTPCSGRDSPGCVAGGGGGARAEQRQRPQARHRHPRQNSGVDAVF